MNILDLQHKARGWHVLAENAGSDGGMSGAGAGGYGSDNGSRGGWARGGYGGYTTGSSENGREGESPAGNVGGYEAGYQSDRAAQDANDLADKLNAVNQNTPVDGISALGAVTNNFGATTSDNRTVSDGGYTYGAVNSLDAAGYGNLVGMNPNNPTQSVGNLQASKNFNDNIAPAAIGLLTSVTGMGWTMAGLRAAGSVASGEKSASDAAKDFAIDFASSKAAGMINSKVASAVGADTMSKLGIASSLSKAVGGPGMPNVGAMAVGSALNAAGISKSTGSGFASTNNAATDNGFTAPGTNYGGSSSGVSPSTPAGAPTSTPATPTPQDVLNTNVNLNLWGGMDGAGWRAAKEHYFNGKGN